MNAPAASIPGARSKMNGKPVFEVPAKSVINFDSGFLPKLLCDGPTFTLGSACPYSCSFCYVPAQMTKNPHFQGITGKDGVMPGAKFEDLVIRRAGALKVLEDQLTLRGKPRFMGDDQEGRVIYSSPLTDVAANVELAKETAEACKIILRLTRWHIRLLTKSNLMHFIADAIPTDCKDRMIYGFSTGTMDDRLSVAFEKGTPKVSKRLENLRRLQDNGHRTFGMLCPSLPITMKGNPSSNPYGDMAEHMAEEIRAERCEHVWAECINLRGKSMERTCQALRDAGYNDHADELARVSGDRVAWETYARCTFMGHVYAMNGATDSTGAPKLRFLQYVTEHTKDWWQDHKEHGAVLLGNIIH